MGSDWIFLQWSDVDEEKNGKHGGVTDKNGGGTKIVDVYHGILYPHKTGKTRESTKKLGINTIQIVLYYTGDIIQDVCWGTN